MNFPAKHVDEQKVRIIQLPENVIMKRILGKNRSVAQNYVFQDRIFLPLLLAYLERPELDCPVYGGGQEQMGEI